MDPNSNCGSSCRGGTECDESVAASGVPVDADGVPVVPPLSDDLIEDGIAADEAESSAAPEHLPLTDLEQREADEQFPAPPA